MSNATEREVASLIVQESPDANIVESFGALLRALEDTPFELRAQRLATEIERVASLAGDAAEAWALFLRVRGTRIARGGASGLLQLAYAEADDSPVTRAAETWLARGLWEKPWLRRLGRPEVWDRAALEGPSLAPEQNAEILWLGFNQDASRVYSLDACGRLRSWDGHYGDCVQTIETSAGRARGAAVKPDGRRVLVVREDGAVLEYDLLTRTEMVRLSAGPDLCSLRLGADGRRIAVVLARGQVDLWNTHDWRLDSTFDCKGAIAALPLARERVLLVLDGGSAMVMDARTGSIALRVDLGEENTLFECDGESLALRSGPRAVRWLDLEEGVWVRSTSEHDEQVAAVATRPGCEFALSASFDASLRAWDASSGELVARWDADVPLTACALGPRGRIAVGDVLGRVMLFH